MYNHHMIDNHEGNLGHWVKRLNIAMTQNVNRILQPYGLTHSQWQVLYYVANTDNEITTQKDLLAKLYLESATLTKLVDTLVRKGWLTREENTIDRRVNTLKLTSAGKRNWQKLPDPIQQGRAVLLKGIDPKDVEQARRVLERAFNNLKATEET